MIHVLSLDIESPHRRTLADVGFGLRVGPKAPNLILDNEKRKEIDITAQRDRYTRHTSGIALVWRVYDGRENDWWSLEEGIVVPSPRLHQ